MILRLLGRKLFSSPVLNKLLIGHAGADKTSRETGAFIGDTGIGYNAQ